MNEFRRRFDDALNRICDEADAAMTSEPERCREIRQQAERDIAELPRKLAPDSTWPADQQRAFEVWRADLIEAQARRRAAG